MDRCKNEPSVTNRKEVIAISVKWQLSWISQNAQEWGVHTHRILNKEGQNPRKTTMYHISPRQNILPIDYGGGHIGKWLPILSQVKSAMALEPNITRKVYSNIVQHFMLVSLNAQFIHISAVLNSRIRD